MNIIDALDDDRFFKPLFRDPSTWKAWRTYLKSLYNIPITDRVERKLFKACTGLRKPPEHRIKESSLVIGRRGGKSRIAALIACWQAIRQDWKSVLAPGERAACFIVAVDKPQAKIIKNYCSAILNSQPAFRRMIKAERAFEIELNNGIDILIKTANFRSLRGYTLILGICEEISFWRDEFSANPDIEVLNALRPALSSVEDSLLLSVSTPYSRSGVLYREFKAHYGKAGGPLIWKAPTAVMNPLIDRDIISQALKNDPSRGKSEWLAEFRQDLEMFLGLDLIEAVTVSKRYELPKIAGITYTGFADPSGGRQDSFTLAIAHKEEATGKIILDAIREKKPPFHPQSIVEEYSALLKSYDVTTIQGDRYSGEWVVSAFRDCGIIYENSERTKSELYLNFLPMVAGSQVELLDHKKLLSQLASLERKTRSGGKDQVDNFLGHDDISNVCAGVCVCSSAEDNIIDSPAWILQSQGYNLSGDDEDVDMDEELLQRELDGEDIDWDDPFGRKAEAERKAERTRNLGKPWGKPLKPGDMED